MTEGVAAFNNVDTPPKNGVEVLDCDWDLSFLVIGTSVFVSMPGKGREERVWNKVSKR